MGVKGRTGFQEAKNERQEFTHESGNDGYHA